MPLAGSAVVINEIMYHPRIDEDNTEYVELFNPSDQPVDLTGWRLQNAINFDFPEGTEIVTQGYLVICRNELFLRQVYSLTSPGVTVGNYAPSSLSNGGETLILEDSLGQEVDRVTYSDNQPWPDDADGDGASLELVHPDVDNRYADSWLASTLPTPGRVNSRASQNPPVRFLSSSRSPRVPGSQDTVSVQFTVHPDDVNANITMLYYVDGTTRGTVSLTRNENRFTAEIPSQADGAVVEYTIEAISQNGFISRAPSGTNVPAFSYRVTDSSPEPGSVIINEIMYNNPQRLGDDREWVELHNPGDSPVDVSYWIVRDRNDENGFLLNQRDLILEPGGYLLVARTTDPLWQSLSLDGVPFSLGDNGDVVRLFDANNQPIDHVRFNDSSEWPAGADGDGGSLERIQTNRDGNEPNNWAVSPFGGTPGEANQRAISDSSYRDFVVVINEIFYHPPDEEYDGNIDLEYIELHNRSAEAIELSGWSFTDGMEYTFGAGDRIPAFGYLLICRNQALYPNVTNKTGNFSLRLNNRGESIALTNDQGIVIDYVPYTDEYPWPVLADGEGVSLELIAPTGDNSLAQMWTNGKPSSPGRRNAVVLSNPPPRITDVQHTPLIPTATASESEFITESIIHPGATWRYFRGREEPPLNWTITRFNDSEWEEGPSGIGYGDGDDATVLSDMRTNYLSVYMRHEFKVDVETISQLALSIDYDDSFVAYLNGVEVARSNVSGSPPAFNRSADGNHGASVDDGALAIDTVDLTRFIDLLDPVNNVLAIQGHNVSLTSSDFTLIPSLFSLREIVPPDEESDDVIIRAEVEDADGIDSVEVQLQPLFTPVGTGLVYGEWITAPMLDDGNGADAFAGDGIYTLRLSDYAEIEANQVWRYRIIAKDPNEGQGVRPVPDDLTRYFSFFVANPVDQSPYPSVRIMMERSVLSDLTRDPDTNVEQPAVVVIDGIPYDLTQGGGVRFRGQTGQPRKSWRIRFTKGDRWLNQRVMNLDANNHVSPVVDGESGVLEHLAFEMFRMAGAYAPQSEHRRVILNGDYYGLFLQVEEYNEDFLERVLLPEETHIFRAGVGNRSSVLNREPDRDSYLARYESEIGRSSEVDVLIEFIERLNTEEATRSFFETHLDVERYINYLAAVAMVSHFDSVEKNYYLMRAPDGRWSVLPWNCSATWGNTLFSLSFPLDTDLSPLDGAEGGVFGSNRLRQKFLSVPDFRTRYALKVRDLAETVFTPDAILQMLDEYWNYIEPAVLENVARWDSDGQMNRFASELGAYVTGRRSFLLQHPLLSPDGQPEAPIPDSPLDGDEVLSRQVALSVIPPVEGDPLSVEWEVVGVDSAFHWSMVDSTGALTIRIPGTTLTAGESYQWRARWLLDVETGWSLWSDQVTFSVPNTGSVPNVENILVTNLDQSARLEWEQPLAADLLRVDVFDPLGRIVESTRISDNRIRIRDLENGQRYTFTLRTVNQNLQQSSGVSVVVQPVGPAPLGNQIAYFRFEESLDDETGRFTDAELFGAAELGSPGGLNPVPATGQQNSYSLNLTGTNGEGMRFGLSPSALNTNQVLTMEAMVQLNPLDAGDPQVLLDRYDAERGGDEAVWRWGFGLTQAGHMEFWLNDDDSSAGIDGRLHFVSEASITPMDGLFHHVAVVVDLRESRVSDKVKLFFDGERVASSVVHEDGDSNYDRLHMDSAQPVWTGSRPSAGAESTDVLSGRIDEVRLVADALSPTQFLVPGDDPVSVEEWSIFE